MIIIITFLLLLAVMVAFYFFHKKRKSEQSLQATVKRRHEPRYQKKHRSSLGRNPLETNQSDAQKQKKDVLLDEESSQSHYRPHSQAQQAENQPLTYIALHIAAPKDNLYVGYELLQALLANGLRFGDMNIFHYYKNKSDKSSLLFSLASLNKPGTFDLTKMGGYSCPGLTLFMKLPQKNHPLEVFEHMLETACQLQDDLGGQLWDENRQPLDMNKIIEIRNKINSGYASQSTSHLGNH